MAKRRGKGEALGEAKGEGKDIEKGIPERKAGTERERAKTEHKLPSV